MTSLQFINNSTYFLYLLPLLSPVSTIPTSSSTSAIQNIVTFKNLLFNFWKINLNFFTGAWEGYPPKKFEIFLFLNLNNIYLGKVNEFGTISSAVISVILESMVGGVETPPPPARIGLKETLYSIILIWTSMFVD